MVPVVYEDESAGGGAAVSCPPYSKEWNFMASRLLKKECARPSVGVTKPHGSY